jgi:hypothetical protein
VPASEQGIKTLFREGENMGEVGVTDVPAEAPLAPTEDQGENVESVETPLEPPCEKCIWLLLAIRIYFLGMDLTDYKPKVDHFEQIHALGKENVVLGAPNFRQVNLLIVLISLNQSVRCQISQCLGVLNLQRKD